MKRWLIRIGVALAAVVALLAIGVGVAIATSNSRLEQRYEVASVSFEAVTDPAGIAEGERLYRSRGCGDCHGDRGEGRVVIDDVPGRFVGTNLTALSSDYTDEALVRAIRDGIAPDGRALVFMPSHEFHGFSDGDVGAIVAFVRTLPRVESDLPTNEVRPLGNLLHFAGLFPLLSAEKIDHAAPRRPAPAVAPTAEYGRYLAAGCTGCHGEGLSGGSIPGAPPELGVPANITPHESGLRDWSEADFVRVMREGIRPDGRRIDPKQMPWLALRHMNDVELAALFAYLKTVPARPAGER
ncbi:MAG: c-type cytochrome [Polyangiaceae bacterium]|nr:c-type cytochrome [Polyangiaceae bacterium]